TEVVPFQSRPIHQASPEAGPFPTPPFPTPPRLRAGTGESPVATWAVVAVAAASQHPPVAAYSKESLLHPDTYLDGEGSYQGTTSGAILRQDSSGFSRWSCCCQMPHRIPTSRDQVRTLRWEDSARLRGSRLSGQ